MSYSTDTEKCSGWGVGLSAIIGGALGYWAGRSSMPYGAVPPPMGGMPYAAAGVVAANVDNGNNGCRTCYQQGMLTGQTLAGLDYIAQKAASNADVTREGIASLSNTMNNQFANVQAQFNSLWQQKIADQAAEIAALKTQNVVGLNAAATNAQLVSINDKISSIVTNCGVRAYPGCPTTCACNG